MRIAGATTRAIRLAEYARRLKDSGRIAVRLPRAKERRLLITEQESLARFMLELGLVEPEKLRLTVAARREKAKALVEGGMSQRAAAAALGVSHTTVQNDLAANLPENGNYLATDRPARREEAILNNEALAAVSVQVRHHVDEAGVVRKPSMVQACKDLLAEIKMDPALAAALGGARHSRVS
jgi:hypothetical protein